MACRLGTNHIIQVLLQSLFYSFRFSSSLMTFVNFRRFWQNVCQSFAEQLLEKGYALQAATYMMAMHRHAEAIEMLLSKYYYTEALLIGRVHLQDDDPLLVAIIDKWIAHLAMAGNLTGSALM